jgi:hypothetical protein
LVEAAKIGVMPTIISDGFSGMEPHGRSLRFKPRLGRGQGALWRQALIVDDPFLAVPPNTSSKQTFGESSFK